jgi:hypothetical protein
VLSRAVPKKQSDFISNAASPHEGSREAGAWSPPSVALSFRRFPPIHAPQHRVVEMATAENNQVIPNALTKKFLNLKGFYVIIIINIKEKYKKVMYG